MSSVDRVADKSVHKIDDKRKKEKKAELRDEDSQTDSS